MIQVVGKKYFHLYTENTSYIIGILPSGHVGSLYYGDRIRLKEDYRNLYQGFTSDGGIEPKYKDGVEITSLNTTCLEFSTFGKSDYREPSLHFKKVDGSRVSDFIYHEHKVYEGKTSLDGLPHFYQNGDRVSTLEIHIKDCLSSVRAILVYNVFYDKDLITRSVRVINEGKEDISLQKIMSFNMDMPQDDFEMISFEGHWIREKHIQRNKLQRGITTIGSKRLSSSAIHNPFLALVKRNTDENTGECYGFALVYSGNHQGTVEVSTHGITRVQMGINSFDFSWNLKAQEAFQTPEVAMTFSSSGLNGMSRNFHKSIRENLIPKQWQYKERPVLFNSWEAFYFDFDEKKLMKLIKDGKALGMELFVLDDGWFKGRNDDTSSLGDWSADRNKLPNGLKGLSKKVKGCGMEFGIWVEPEMISKNSDLFKEHRDWAIKIPYGEPSLGRNQLILDMSNEEVIEYLFNALSKVFEEARVSYVKWDMNRNGTDLYSSKLSPDDQESLAHRYYIGLYKLLDRLVERFPYILFESCASGGNRHDLGMLYYMPQTWISDNTDPGERMNIQYGASLLFPSDTVAAHVGSNPSHQVLRNNDIETRFNIAAFGTLGYELNLTKLSSFEKRAIKKQVEDYKRVRRILQFGELYRIQSPFDSNHCIMMSVESDKKSGVLGYFQKVQGSNLGFEQIKIRGLKEDIEYRIHNRKQFFNIEKFGELVNDHFPFEVKTSGMKGLLLKTISEHYMQECEYQCVSGYGDEFMKAGFRPYHQFVGLDYNETTRIIGDFGSRLYFIEEIID